VHVSVHGRLFDRRGDEGAGDYTRRGVVCESDRRVDSSHVQGGDAQQRAAATSRRIALELAGRKQPRNTQHQRKVGIAFVVNCKGPAAAGIGVDLFPHLEDLPLPSLPVFPPTFLPLLPLPISLSVSSSPLSYPFPSSESAGTLYKLTKRGPGQTRFAANPIRLF